MKDFALALYGLSLMLPAVGAAYGWEILLHGYWSIMYGGIAWFANFTFIPAYIFRKARKVLVYSLVTIALGLTSLAHNSIWNDNEGKMLVMSYNYGFYVWMLSFVWLAAVSMRELRQQKMQSPSTRI